MTMLKRLQIDQLKELKPANGTAVGVIGHAFVLRLVPPAELSRPGLPPQVKKTLLTPNEKRRSTR
jgi:hypothetical protein